MPADLLDVCANHFGLLISDIKRKVSLKNLTCFFVNLDDNQFSAEEWSEAFSYLFSKEYTFSSAQEAKQYIQSAEKDM